MIKSELVAAVAAHAGLSKAQTARMLAAAVEVISAELIAGGCVKVSGFGEWCLKETAERAGRNPQTGEVLVIPAGRKVVFKASPNLKKSI
jgi:DNA-binding protein HU-beta